MAMNRFALRNTLTLLTCALALALCLGAGCSREEPVEPDAPEAVTPDTATAEKPALPPEPEVVSMLGLMPERADMAVAVPDLPGYFQRTTGFLDRVLPAQAEFAGNMRAAVAELGRTVGAPDAQDLAGVLAAMGVNPARTLALFVDFEPSIRDTEAMPLFTIAMPCTDVALAEAKLREAFGPDAQGAPAEPSVTPRNGIEIHSYGPHALGWFVWGDHVVAGNSLAMLEGVADRTSDPVAVPYGTDKYPIEDPRAIAQLAWPARMAEFYGSALPELVAEWWDMAPLVLPLILGGMGADEAYEHAPHPLLTTITWAEDRFETRSRVELADFPELEAATGRPDPLSITPLWPEDTHALWTLAFTPEARARMEASLTEAMAGEASQSPQAAMGAVIGRQVVQMLGNELALAAVTGTDGLPALKAALRLRAREDAQMILMTLGMFGLGDSAKETYKNVEISEIPLPLDTPLHFALHGDLLLVTTGLANMKALIDRVDDGTPSGLFQRLEPPLDPGKPYHNLVVFRSSVIDEVLAPLFAVDDLETAETLARIRAAVRQVRYVKMLEGGQQVSTLTIHEIPQ